ncbi:hypothetical protein V8C86DRAFT_2446288 [Haematococcus lacustris]
MMRITATTNLFRVCKRPRPKQFRVNARDRRQGPEAPGGGRERSRGTARPRSFTNPEKNCLVVDCFLNMLSLMLLAYQQVKPNLKLRQELTSSCPLLRIDVGLFLRWHLCHHYQVLLLAD